MFTRICICNIFDFYHSAAIRIEYGSEIQIEFDNWISTEIIFFFIIEILLEALTYRNMNTDNNTKTFADTKTYGNICRNTTKQSVNQTMKLTTASKYCKFSVISLNSI